MRRAAEEVLGRVRASGNGARPAILDELVDRLESLRRQTLQRVINATGIILHTNLGRAPLAAEALAAVAEVARGYSNLEYDLETG